MPKLLHVSPKYRHHKASGQAVVTLSGVDHYLGPWKSKRSKSEYDRLVGEWLASGRRLPAKANDTTVVELCAAYWRFVALDNLSHLATWLSDMLCRLSTGGGFSTRMLYTDDEEMIFDAMRPVIINGIEEVATRGDLIDRSILLRLRQINGRQRRTEAEFRADFLAKRPMLLGAILDGLSTAIRNLPQVRLTTLPRMADFARLAAAAEPGLV